MSFGASASKALPAPAQKPLGIDETRASTNEQARPVSYLAGTNRIGVTWISDVFNVRADNVSNSIGKGGAENTGYNYFASFAGLLVHGPLDFIKRIYFNGEIVWEGLLERSISNPDFVDITIEGYGEARLYWGTATQTVDSHLLDSGFDHPPYKRQAYIRFKDLFLGFNQTSVQNVEIICGRYPAPGWMTADANIDGDANVIGIISDWLTNPVYGLGWDEDELDTDLLDDVANQLVDEGLGLSPYIARSDQARSLILQLLEYIDGYPCFNAAGQFGIGLVRSPADLEALPVIDEDDLIEEPQLDPGSWLNTKPVTWLKFTDRTFDYKENALPYRDAGGFGISTDNSPQTIERPWITKPASAQMLLAAAGRTAALPIGNGNLSIRKASAGGLQEGSPFRFSYSHYGLTDLLLRVQKISIPDPAARKVDIEVSLDRSYLNEQFYLPPDEAPPTPVTYPPEPFVDQRIWEVPYQLSIAGRITLAALAVRTNKYTTRFNIHLRNEQAIAAATISGGLTQIGAPANCHTGADYPITATLDKTIGVLVDITGLSSGPLATLNADIASAFAANKLALKIVQSLSIEFLTVIDLVQLSSTEYRFYVVRGRFGTTPFASTSGAQATIYRTGNPQFTISYTLLASQDGFALHGLLEEDYPITSDLIDEVVGTLVQLDSIDNTIDPLSLNDSLANQLLMLVDDEIISIGNVELVDVGKYRIFGIRARYDTRRQAHANGAEVLIVRRAVLHLLQDSNVFTYLAQPRFKLQPVAFGNALDLSEITPVDAFLTNRVAKPIAPINLSVNGDGSHPTYESGDDLIIAWDLCSERRGDFWALWGNPMTVLPFTVLQFYTTGGVLKLTHTTAAGDDSYTLTNANLVTAFAGEPDIVVRAYAGYASNLISLFYDQTTVRKI